jgi:hypothetical protein
MAVGEWDQRQLCPDGACVGVIGPDGTCKVCGRAAPNWGDERKRGLIDPPDDDEDDDGRDPAVLEDEPDDDGDDDYGDDEDGEDDDDGDDETADRDGRIIATGGASSAGAGSEWTARRLCPDGSCIGVIGADGRCKVCGRSTGDAAPGDGRDNPVISPAEPVTATAVDPEEPSNAN